MTGELKAHETIASDALERLAKVLGVGADLDDPEPALIAAVERKVAELVDRCATLGDAIKDSRCPCLD